MYVVKVLRSETSHKLGRLVNQGRHTRHTRSAVMKVVNCDGKPALALCILQKSKQGGEILYDCGIDTLPREKVSNEISEIN